MIFRLAAVVLALLFSCGPSMGSIGAVLGKHNATGRVIIREAPPGMAAAAAGLQAGDQLLLIDGRDVRSMTPEEVHEALVGPIGTSAQLTVEREGYILRVAVKRARLRDGPRRTE